MDMKYRIEIIVDQERERELPHLAGIAAAELALAVGADVGAPLVTFFQEVAPAGRDPALVAALAFAPVTRGLSADEVDALREKIEGARRREKRCASRILVERETPGGNHTTQQ
jgi:hypothetical protein